MVEKDEALIRVLGLIGVALVFAGYKLRETPEVLIAGDVLVRLGAALLGIDAALVVLAFILIVCGYHKVP